MKSFIAIMAILVSSSVFAQTFSGQDASGRPCSLTLETVDVERNFLVATVNFTLGINEVEEQFSMNIGTTYNPNDTLSPDFSNITGANHEAFGTKYTTNTLHFDMIAKKFTYKRTITVVDQTYSTRVAVCNMK